MANSRRVDIGGVGAGNSGGPVFDGRGRVIGIFTYGLGRQADAQFSFAVPARFAVAMTIKPFRNALTLEML